MYHPEPKPGSTISKWGGFVDDLEDFDPEFFGISGDEAKNLDPAIRDLVLGIHKLKDRLLLVRDTAQTLNRDAGKGQPAR